MSAFTMRLKKVCKILDAHGQYDDVYPANETVYYDGFSSPLNLWESDNAEIVNIGGRMAVSGTNFFSARLDLPNLIIGRTYNATIQAMSDDDGFETENVWGEINYVGAPGGGLHPLTWQMIELPTLSFVATSETMTLQVLGQKSGQPFTVKFDNIRVTGDAFTVQNPSNFDPVGLGSYPIFDASYRDGLNQKIVDHFWNREIGFETLELFTMKMKTVMNEIMPYYNQLYKTTLIEYDALSTIDLSTESTAHAEETGSSQGDSTALNTTDGQSRAVTSTTPQTMLAGDEDYATGAADTRSVTEADSTAAQTSNTQTESDTIGDTRVTGYQGAPATLIMNYRDSLINIDLMVIRDLEQLFMQIFDNSSTYTQRGLFL